MNMCLYFHVEVHCKKFNFGHEIRFLSIWDFSQIFVRFFSMRFSSDIYEIFLKSWDLSHKVMRIFHLHEIFLKYIWDFSLGVLPLISRRFFSNCENNLIKQWEFLVVYKRYSSYIKENCCSHTVRTSLEIPACTLLHAGISDLACRHCHVLCKNGIHFPACRKGCPKLYIPACRLKCTSWLCPIQCIQGICYLIEHPCLHAGSNIQLLQRTWKCL